MKAQRRGTDLSIMIRLELSALGRDPYQHDGKRLTVAGIGHAELRRL